MYHMLSQKQQAQIKQIEQRALAHFIDDLLSICAIDDQHSEPFSVLKQRVSN